MTIRQMPRLNEGTAVTIRYLTTTEFAQRLGLKDRSSLPKNLPTPDALIGTKRGWLPETVDAWDAARPGHGGRPPKTN